MFTFLNPALLLASAAALIPLIIHLLSRRRVKVVEFSSIRHLKAMQRRQVRRLKIRQILLLLLRMLLVFVLVLAFARPTTKSGAFGSQASASSVVIIDNTASMNRFVPNGQLFELARKRTDALLAAFSTDDRVAILPMVASDFKPSLVTPALAREQVATLTAQDASADLRSTIELASALLEQSPSLNREIYLVTDRQRTLIPDSLPSDSARLGSTRVTVVELPLDQPGNVGVNAVSLGTQLLSVGVPFTISSEIANKGMTDVENLMVSLFVDHRRVSQTTISLAAGQVTSVPFTTSVPSTGMHSGYIELSADQFPGDNRSYFGFKLPELVSVLVVGDDPGGRLTRMALQPAPDASSYWSVKQADEGALLSLPLDEYQVMVLAGTPNLGAIGRERVNRFLAAGKSVFVLLGATTTEGAFDADYAELTGLRLESAMPEVLTRSGFFLLKSIANDHPIFNIFDTKQLPEIKSFTLPKLSWSGSKGGTLMTFSGDRLAMTERKIGRGKVITLGVPLDPSLSEFATTALFVPFLARTIEYLAADVSAYESNLSVGQPLRRILPPSVTAASRVELIRPDSTSRELSPEFTDEKMSILLADTRQAGIWRVEIDDRLVDQIPLNLNPAEGDLRALPIAEFASSLNLPTPTTLPVGGDIAPLLASLRYGRELWPMLLWFALGLIALELWLSKSAARDDEPG